MNPSTALTLILCAVTALPVLGLLGWALCRISADTRPVDDGRAFGGDDE